MAPAALEKEESIRSAGGQPVRTPPAAPWHVVGAAVLGLSHERLGLPCQDAQGARLLDDGTLLVAVADGAGSAAYSDRGASMAVQIALESMAGWLQGDARLEAEEALRLAVQEAREAVLRLPESWQSESGAEAGDGEDPPTARAYACTLTCAIAGDRLVVGQIGDGAVVASGPGVGDSLFTVTRLQRGEYANETHFLVQDDALDRLMIDVVDQPVARLAVMSDGLIRLALKMPAQEPHEPFFAPLFRFVEMVTDPEEAEAQLAGFLSSERVNARTDDDKSLVLAVRKLPGVNNGGRSPDRAEE